MNHSPVALAICPGFYASSEPDRIAGRKRRSTTMDEARRVENDYERSTPDGGFGSDLDGAQGGKDAGGNVTNMMDKAKEQLEPTMDKAKEQLDGGVDKAKEQVDAGMDKAASG